MVCTTPVPVVPPQDIRPWDDALGRLLSNRRFYGRLSETSQIAARQLVSRAGIADFEDWLLNLPRASARPGDAPAGTMLDEADDASGFSLAGLARLQPDETGFVCLAYGPPFAVAKARGQN